MLKRLLHTANTVVTHPETHTGTRELAVEGTVNDNVDLLRIGGDSWQLQQEQGKNLYDMKNATYRLPDSTGVTVTFDGEKIILNGTSIGGSTSAWLVTFLYNYEIKTSGDYVFTLSNSEDIAFYTVVNGTYFGGDSAGAIKANLKIGDVLKCGFCSKVAGTVFENKVLTFQIEKGTESTPYEAFHPPMPSPEYQSEIKSVGGELVSSGWNYIQNPDVTLKRIEMREVFNGNVTGDYKLKFTIVNQEQETDRPATSFIGATVDGKIKHYAIGWNDRLISISGNITNVTIYNWCAFIGRVKVMMVEGEDKPYDRYRGSSITIPTLRKIRDNDGNVVAEDVMWIDRMRKKTWVERKIKKSKVSDLSFSVYSDIGMYHRFETNDIKDKLFTRENTTNLMCDTLKVIPYNKNAEDTISERNNYNFIRILTSKYSTLEELYAGIGDSVILYALAEPYTEELDWSDDYLLDTAQYQTNIRFTDLDEHLQPTIEATVKVLGR